MKGKKHTIKHKREQSGEMLLPNPGTSPDSIINNITAGHTGSAPALPTQSNTMEVHHHAHHNGKRNWKSYFWEFLMLFLAVFCGFLAEYQLEHVIENSKEKEYIASMITDAEIDTASLNKAIYINTQTANGLDSLANLCYDFQNTDKDTRKLYNLFGTYAANFESARFTDRTRTQLKNSGNLRLIRNKTAADNITLYDNSINEVLTQEGAYSEFMKEQIKAAQLLFNFKYFQQRFSKVKPETGPVVSISLLTKDAEDLIKYGNKIFMMRGIVLKYIAQLKLMEIRAAGLIKMLKAEYRL